MNKREHLLLCLSEELGEASHAISKALRFGLDTKFEKRPTTARQDLINELVDVRTLIQLLKEEGIDLSAPPDFQERVTQKREKLAHMMKHSKAQKTLQSK